MYLCGGGEGDGDLLHGLEHLLAPRPPDLLVQQVREDLGAVRVAVAARARGVQRQRPAARQQAEGLVAQQVGERVAAVRPCGGGAGRLARGTSTSSSGGGAAATSGFRLPAAARGWRGRGGRGR